MLKVRTWIWTLGLLFTQLFIVCVIRDLVSPLPTSVRRLMEVFLPGFHWLNMERFLIGLAESFIWGVYAAMLFVPMANIFLLKHRHDSNLHRGHHGRYHHRAAA